jgi:hypothetical protein
LPFLLSSNSKLTSKSQIALTWQSGASNGGAAVSFRVHWD